MSIDIDEMVRMAGERAGWVYSDGMIYEPYIGSKEEERNHTIAVIKHVSEGEFIARAPKTIAYLAARVRVLQAQNAALQARAEALGEWQGVEVVPPYAGHWATQPVHPILMIGWGRLTARGEWEMGFGGHPPHEVIGWRPLPDEPTAAE